MALRNLLRFSLLILTATGFSFGLLYARLFSAEVILSEVIRLQSYVVFLSFFLQLGYRAAIRKYIYSSRLHLAKLMQSFLYLFLLSCAIVGLAVEYFLDSYHFIALSSLMAWLTFKFTIAVSLNNDKEFVLYGISVFLCALIPSISISFFRYNSSFLYFYQEFFSVIVLLVLIFSMEFKKSYRLRGRVLFKTLLESHYYQIGSGVMYMIVFMLAQSIISGSYDIEHLKAYTDIQIMSGFFVLFTGKLLLLYEKTIFFDKSVRFKVFLLLVFLVLTVALLTAFILSNFGSASLVYLIVICFVLLSRPVMGYVVQYFMCIQFNLIMIFVFLLLAGLYLTVGIGNIAIWFFCIPVAVFYVYSFLSFANRACVIPRTG